VGSGFTAYVVVLFFSIVITIFVASPSHKPCEWLLVLKRPVACTRCNPPPPLWHAKEKEKTGGRIIPASIEEREIHWFEVPRRSTEEVCQTPTRDREGRSTYGKPHPNFHTACADSLARSKSRGNKKESKHCVEQFFAVGLFVSFL